MDFTGLFDDAHDGAFYKIIGTKIQDKLRELRQSRPEENARRWGWELLQNAKDVAYDGRPVRASFELVEGAEPRLIARHTGRPFQPEHLYYLIVQTSSKDRPAGDEAPATTGRYGTGFLTTHLLSKVVDVEGVLEAPDELPARFSVTLDRSGQSLEELTAGVKRALAVRDSFDRLGRVERLDEDAYNTAFTYPLDDDGVGVAAQGLEDLERSTPLTLAFTPTVGEVTVRGITFRTSERVSVADGVERVRVTSSGAGGGGSDSFVVVRGERTSVAVRIDVDETGARLLALGEEVPRLFCDFPLLGSESFPLPFAVNSPWFYPDDARSGVYLGDPKDSEVQVNRAALAEVPALFGRLVGVAEQEGWRDRFHLAGFSSASGLPAKDRAWYDEAVMAPCRRRVLEAPLVETAAGEFCPLRRPSKGPDHSPMVWLPHASTDEAREGIWRFAMAKPDRRRQLPRKEHVHVWDQVAWAQCGTMDLSHLVRRVSEAGDVVTLASSHGASEGEAIEWLGELVAFLIEHGEEQLLGPHKARMLYATGPTGTYSWKSEAKRAPILPNQYGVFCLNGDLYLDGELDDSLKDIAVDLGHDIRGLLLHRDVFLEERHVKGTKTSSDLAKAIEEAVKDRVKGARSEGTRRAFRALYLWIKVHDAEARDLFGMWLYEHRALLVPPEDVIDLMDRVPALEKENAALREERAALQAERAALEAERQQLLQAGDDLRSDGDRYRELQAWLEAEGLTWDALPAFLEGRKEFAERGLEAEHDDAIAQLVRELRALNVTSVEELEAYVQANPNEFKHHPEGTVERYVLFRQKAERAQAAVREHLARLGHYDLSEWQACPERPTVVLGVQRRDRVHGRPLLLVVRPSDGGRVIFYHEEELTALRDAEAELWVEDPDRGVQRLTLGRVLEELRDRLGVNQLPVS